MRSPPSPLLLVLLPSRKRSCIQHHKLIKQLLGAPLFWVSHTGAGIKGKKKKKDRTFLQKAISWLAIFFFIPINMAGDIYV